MRFETRTIPSPQDPTKPLLTPWGTEVRRPEIHIELLDSIGDAPFDTWAVVDSGADISMVNVSYALSLGIDLSKIKEIEVKGIYNESVKAKPSKVTFRFTKLKEEIELPVLFIDSQNVNVLLGREVFFSEFKIRFNIAKGFFYVEKPRI